MKNRLFLVALSVLLALAGVVYPAQPAMAYQYTYMAEDPSYQTTDSPLTDNFVMFKWWKWDVVTWYADGSIWSDAQTAISSWSSAFPMLLWEYTGDEVNAEVRFYYDEFFVNWIGAQFLTEDRTLYRQIRRTDYPSAGAGSHKMCGKPYFQGTGQFGNYRCSNTIWLN